MLFRSSGSSIPWDGDTVGSRESFEPLLVQQVTGLDDVKMRTEACNVSPRKDDEPGRLGRAILDRAAVHVPDVRNDRNFDQNAVRAAGLGAVLAIPMLRDGQPIGVIGVSRSTTGPFPERQIELLQTFADQAVIAIENVRLFKELEERNGALAKSLEQQTATAEILRVISRSQTDVQPVFDTIADNAVSLFRPWRDRKSTRLNSSH